MNTRPLILAGALLGLPAFGGDWEVYCIYGLSSPERLQARTGGNPWNSTNTTGRWTGLDSNYRDGGLGVDYTYVKTGPWRFKVFLEYVSALSKVDRQVFFNLPIAGSGLADAYDQVGQQDLKTTAGGLGVDLVLLGAWEVGATADFRHMKVEFTGNQTYYPPTGSATTTRPFSSSATVSKPFLGVHAALVQRYSTDLAWVFRIGYAFRLGGGNPDIGAMGAGDLTSARSPVAEMAAPTQSWRLSVGARF